MASKRSSELAIPILGGVLVALIALLLIVLLTRDDGPAASPATSEATTTTAAEGTTTTSGDMTTTTAGVTTSEAATTTTASTTTVAATTTAAFGGDTATKSNSTITGSPGGSLTDVRLGQHPGFVRVVFEFVGSGEPIWDVGYASPPFVGGGSGEVVPVDGTHFLLVHVAPGARYDSDYNLTYLGPTEIDPGYPPIDEVVFVDDFEADMTWVIGLTGERPFLAYVLQSPLRLVIDIAAP